jgi:hypothetical protein
MGLVTRTEGFPNKGGGAISSKMGTPSYHGEELEMKNIELATFQ